MIPIRCYSCNAPLAQLWARYRDRCVQGEATRSILDGLHLDRVCCRTAFLCASHPVHDYAAFGNDDAVLDDAGTVLRRRVRNARTVPCD